MRHAAEPKPAKEKPVPAADNSDGEDADFEEDLSDDDDDSSDDDELDPAQKNGGGEVEAEDLEEGGGDGGVGPSAAVKKRKATDDDPFGRIEHGLSGDEVDAGNIIEGGRRARRGRGGDSKQQYTAKAEVASDEDSW